MTRHKQVTARQVACDVLDRIDPGGAFANVLLPHALESSGLDERDRRFVTELVYGTTRMRRACDFLVDRFLARDVEPSVRNVLRAGAYQLVHLGVPPHAAVGETVTVAPRAARGLVNAVLRKVATAPSGFPTPNVELSYPDWIVERLTADLGAVAALDALRAMNEPAAVTVRADGYVQDLASQWVAEAVGARPGERIADVCAAPGGKATAMAGAGAFVAAGDVSEARTRLVVDNAARLGSTVAAVCADARRPPLRDGAFDRVLLDAPCSGLGVLRRRPDARWRVVPEDVHELAALQRSLLDATASLVPPGGVLVYSACTLTEAETRGLDEHAHSAHPGLEALPAPEPPWMPWGRGALLLPQAAGTDGMFVLRLRRT